MTELRKIDDGSRVVFGRQTWEHHPDGAGGFRPIEAHRRGAVNLPCTHCGVPLVREGTDEIIRETVFGCTNCHHASVGADVRVSPAQPPPAI